MVIYRIHSILQGKISNYVFNPFKPPYNDEDTIQNTGCCNNLDEQSMDTTNYLTGKRRRAY